MPDPEMIDTVEFMIPPEFRANRPKPSFVVSFGACSDIGRVREDNQDHYLICRMGRAFDIVHTSLPSEELIRKPEDFAHAMVIADGMGGMAAGGRASMLAIRTGMQLVLESPKWALAINESESAQLIERLNRYFLKVDEAVVREVQNDDRLTGMGTTLTVAYTVGEDLFLVHAGDSRAYLYRPGLLRQLTADHTLPGRKNVLTNFVGVQGIEPEISTWKIRSGDRLLLCTDGLNNMVDDEEIADILGNTPDPQNAASKLVDRALENGGKDNVTVMLAAFQARE